MQTNPFDQFDNTTTAAPPPVGPTLVPLAPPDPQRAQQQQLETRLDQLQVQGAELQNRQREEDLAKAARERELAERQRGEISSTAEEIRNVIAAARRAQARSREGWFMTGIGADWIGANTAEGRSLRGDLDVIGSNTAFERLQRMRAESPTGGALGSITERELALLQNTIASLDPGQTDVDFQRNMQTIIDRYQAILERLDPEAAPPQRASAPPEENPDPAVQEMRDDPTYIGRVGQGIDPNTGRPVNETPPEGRGNGIIDNIDAIVRGIADVPTFGQSDEISAWLDSQVFGGSQEGNLARQRSVDRYDELNHPLERFGGQLGGGFLLPVGAASTPARLTVLGGASGGAYAYGSAEGSVADRLAAAGEGVITGAAVAGPLGLIGHHLPRLGRQSRASDLIDAADRQGIRVLPGDVGGAPTRMLTGGVNQSLIGGSQIRRGAERTADDFADRVGTIARSEGQPARREVLGETLEGALQGFNTRSAAEGRATYRRATEMADDQLFQGSRAFQNLNAQIRELSSTPNTSADLIGGMDRLRRDIATDQGLTSLPIDAIRRLRTNVRAEAQSEGLRATDYQRRAGEVLDTLSDDIARQLPDDAAAEFRRADAAWRERLNFIDDVETRLLGPQGDRSAEQVTQRLMAMTRGDSGRFRRTLEQVSDEEAGIIRGSVINEMGRPPDGQPGNFSIETWAKNYRALPDRTRDALFRGQNRQHADDLLRIAEGVEGTNRFRNTSNTAGAINMMDLLRATTSGSAAYASGGTTLAGELIVGRLLASPGVARLLAQPAQTVGAATRRLSRLAVRQPELAPYLEAMIEQLRQQPADEANPQE